MIASRELSVALLGGVLLTLAHDCLASTVIRSQRCGTVEVSPVESGEEGAELYRFTESGTLRKAGLPTGTTQQSVWSSMSYVCKGWLIKIEYQLTAGTNWEARQSAATCTFTAANGDSARVKASSAGYVSQGIQPPPVNFTIVSGTGRLAGIRGSGTGKGLLPLRDQSSAIETCARLDWKIQ